MANGLMWARGSGYTSNTLDFVKVMIHQDAKTNGRIASSYGVRITYPSERFKKAGQEPQTHIVSFCP